MAPNQEKGFKATSGISTSVDPLPHAKVPPHSGPGNGPRQSPKSWAQKIIPSGPQKGKPSERKGLKLGWIWGGKQRRAR